MVRHNNMLPNVHLNKDWQEKVKTWFNQPGRKKRRRINRLHKAKTCAPNPTHNLRPVVRGQTNKYNNKIRLGRGFTIRELKEAGIKGINYARSIGIAIDLRRKDTCNETLSVNVNRIKEYTSKMILYPKNIAKPDKKAQVKEATQVQLNAPESKMQNTCKAIIPLPKENTGYSFSAITKEMRDIKIYHTLRKEIKTAKGIYKRMEERKKKKSAAATGKKK